MPTARLYPILDDSQIPKSPKLPAVSLNTSILDLDESINFNVSCLTCSDTCPLCMSPVLDGDDGLGCEGKCARWFHAACLGIDHHEYLFIKRLSSNIKFLCSSCYQTPDAKSIKPTKPASRFAVSRTAVLDLPPDPDQITIPGTPVAAPAPDPTVPTHADPDPNSIRGAPAAEPHVTAQISGEQVCSSSPNESNSCQPQVRIVYGAADPLSNMFAFDFWVNNCRFKSLEQVYHYDRAYRQGKPGLAHQILQTSNPFLCKKLARPLQKQPVADVELMRSLLRLKLDQCDVFRNSLVETIGKTILHSTHKGDTFWCTGLEHDDIDAHNGTFTGKNKFGMLLTELRDSSLKIQCEGNDNNVSLLNKSVSFPSQFNVLTANQSRCNNCFETGHSQASCGFKRQVFCRSCGKKGHKQKFCGFFGGNPYQHQKHPNNAFGPPPPFPMPRRNFMPSSMFNYPSSYAYSMPLPFQSRGHSFVRQQPTFQLQTAPMTSSASTTQQRGGGMSGSQVFPK